MELNWKEDNNLVRKIAKILLGDTLPNGEPVNSLVFLDNASVSYTHLQGNIPLSICCRNTRR